MTTLFQETIEHLLKSHNLLEDFQNKDSFHVRFEKTGYQPLVIERHGEMISVAHYFEQNGDLIADPDGRQDLHRHPLPQAGLLLPEHVGAQYQGTRLGGGRQGLE